MRIGEIRQKKKNAEIQKEIRNRLFFNQQVRNMENGEKRMHQVVQTMKQKAVEAERSGDHESAIRFAMEAQRIGKQLRTTGDMKDTILGVRAISESTRAMNGIMKNVNEMIGGAGALGAEDMIEMQINMETVRENMDYLMETSGETFECFAEDSGSKNREEGERALKNLIKSAEQTKRKNLLTETTKKLDALTKNRVTE